jgi:Tfp pilus assembly protein PilO
MNSRDRSILAVIVLLVVAGVGYLLLVSPKHREMSQVKNTIATAQSQLTQVEASVQAGLGAESQYGTYNRQLKAIRTAVPNDDQIPELINQLQASSDRNHVGFQTVSVSAGSTSSAGTATTTAAFPSQSFSLSFTGSYFAVTRLFGDLAAAVQADDKHFHATGRLISISTLSLSPGGSATSAAQTAPGSVTAAVTAVDYDVPSALTLGSSAASTSTASPAAYVTPQP